MDPNIHSKDPMAGRMKPWQVYSFAIAATLATLCLRLVLDGPLGGRPTLILFVLPIMLSGYVGGLRAGLLATALAYFASFFLAPPFHSFHATTSAEYRQPQLFIVLIGIAVSVLNEAAVHRARDRAELAFHLTEDALVKAENMQNAIFNCPNFSCIATDANGIIQFFNVGAERMFGYSAAEVVNKITPAELHDEQDVIARAQALSTQYGSAVKPGFETIAFRASRGIEDNYDITKIRKDGSRFAAIVSITALRDANDDVIGYLLIATDNTARQQVEEERSRSGEELKKTNIKLELAKSAAERANSAKSEFLSNMSHELRTPLNAILGFAQLMESSDPPPTTSQTKSIAQILHAGWYLFKLINEVLDLAAIESGKLPLQQEAVSLAELFATCQSMVEPQAQQRGIHMTFPDFKHPIFVRADHTRLKQVLINLLSNAIKYNNENGFVIVDYMVSASGRIRISVQDTGAGLPPEKVAQLFTPFNRLGQENTEVAGTGIGLVVSKRLTEAMDGQLGVESTEGKGSTFWFELLLTSEPKVDILTDTQSMIAPDISDNPRQRTLLYVEDNPANMTLVEEILKRYPDLRLVTAVNASLGIELVHSTQPQVILMDINLPGISGLKALRILREDPITANIPVIALSANAMQRDIEAGLEAGFFRYLTKPVRIREFTTTLNDALKVGEEQWALAEAGEKIL